MKVDVAVGTITKELQAAGTSASCRVSGEPRRMMKAKIASWQRNAGKRLLERVGVAAGKVVLDFGCREGNYAKIAAQIVGPTGMVYALDKNHQILDDLMRSVREKGLGNIVRLDTSGNVLLPLRDASVDVVLLYDVLHLIGWSGESGKTIRCSATSDRRAVLKELFRISKLTGVISIYCPHLATHTDVDSEQDIAKELESEGFDLRDSFYAMLVHDGNLVQGHIMNFMSRAGTNRKPC